MMKILPTELRDLIFGLKEVDDSSKQFEPMSFLRYAGARARGCAGRSGTPPTTGKVGVVVDVELDEGRPRRGGGEGWASRSLKKQGLSLLIWNLSCMTPTSMTNDSGPRLITL